MKYPGLNCGSLDITLDFAAVPFLYNNAGLFTEMQSAWNSAHIVA